MYKAEARGVRPCRPLSTRANKNGAMRVVVIEENAQCNSVVPRVGAKEGLSCVIFRDIVAILRMKP